MSVLRSPSPAVRHFVVVGHTPQWRPTVSAGTPVPTRTAEIGSAGRVQRQPRVPTVEPVVSPAVPPAQTPATPAGAGGASGGSGFFFFVAALLALAGLLVPRVIGTLRTNIGLPPPQPFLRLLARPG